MCEARLPSAGSSREPACPRSCSSSRSDQLSAELSLPFAFRLTLYHLVTASPKASE